MQIYKIAGRSETSHYGDSHYLFLLLLKYFFYYTGYNLEKYSDQKFIDMKNKSGN